MMRSGEKIPGERWFPGVWRGAGPPGPGLACRRSSIGDQRRRSRWQFDWSGGQATAAGAPQPAVSDRRDDQRVATRLALSTGVNESNGREATVPLAISDG